MTAALIGGRLMDWFVIPGLLVILAIPVLGFMALAGLLLSSGRTLLQGSTLGIAAAGLTVVAALGSGVGRTSAVLLGVVVALIVFVITCPLLARLNRDAEEERHRRKIARLREEAKRRPRSREEYRRYREPD